MSTRQGTIAIAMAAAMMLGAAGGAGANSLTASRDLSGSSVVLQASPDNITPQSDGKTYSWADKDGNGTSNAANANLDLVSYNLTRVTDTIGFTLALNDGTGDGAIAWGGVSGGLISTKRTDGTDKDGSPITITGATDIACSSIDTSGNGTGRGGAIVISQSGNLTVASVQALPKNNYPGGSVTLSGSGKASGSPAGWLQVASGIGNYGTYAATAVIRGYEKVTVGGGGIKTFQTGVGSTANNLTLSNIGTGGVEVAGPVQTYAEKDEGNSTVTISTAGSVKLASVDTHAGNTAGDWVFHNAGSIQLTAGGNVEVTGSLQTYMLGDGSGGAYSRDAGNITITSTNGWVKLNSIITTNKQNNSLRYAGDVSITSGQDLSVNGTINLSSPYGGDRRGTLNLATTGAGSQIIVNDLDCSVFWASGWTFNAAGDKSLVSGTLANFDVGTGNRIRVPSGQVVYYDARLSGNAYLGGVSHPLAGGGQLRPMPRGTVVTFR